jgi:hypothetical protein
MNLQAMNTINKSNTINTIPATKISKKRNQDNSTDDKPKTTKKQKNNNVIVEGNNDSLMLCTVIAGAGEQRDNNNIEVKKDNKVKKLCPHNKSKQKCKECSSYFCLHNKQKYLCKECGGKGNSLIITNNMIVLILFHYSNY